MKKKKIILFSILILLVLLIVTRYLVPKNIDGIAQFINQNSIEVITDEKIDIDQIKIALSISATDYKNIEVFENGSEKTIPKGYGENDWYLSFEGKQFGVFRHFKTNNWHDHHYSFHFYENNGQIKCDAKIDGPDEMHQTVILNKNKKTDIGSQSELKTEKE